MSARWCAGARACMTNFCSRITTRRISTTRWKNSAAYGFPLEKEWFAPHLEFRFPKLGEVAVRDIQVELRHALEPWHVLGEEQTSGGTARYVDSSAERLQVKVNGWVDERYTLACNGAALPMQRTRSAGRICRRRALQGLAALFGPAPDHRRAGAADIRCV